MIIGITGPSGIGKGFIKEHLRNKYPEITELTVVTTRARRDTDDKDRETDVPVGVFLQRQNSGEIVFAHQPFGIQGDWYGFIAGELDKASHPQALVLTEIHIDNVPLFKQRFGKNIVILGLTAEMGYLEQNLSYRNTELMDDRRIRLVLASHEVKEIQRLHASGTIDALVDVHDGIRKEIADIAQSYIEVVIKNHSKKESDI